jgi:hypothetical protein
MKSEETQDIKVNRLLILNEDKFNHYSSNQTIINNKEQ